MKPTCERCKKPTAKKLKLHTYRKKMGKRSKNIVEYYCEVCFKIVETERSWDVHRKKEAAAKIKGIKRLQRRSTKMR